MQWSDDAIVLGVRRHGEAGLVVQLLTRDHGRHAGLVRGGQGRRLRPIYQTGNRVIATWKARLSEHLGSLTAELLQGHAARLMEDPGRLATLASAAAMAEMAVPEREPHVGLFEDLAALLEALDRDAGWAVSYVMWEMRLLTELGFGLDLSRCAATGTTDSLVYVSPKSGQAVSAEAGEPYKDKLLSLPPFLLREGEGSNPAEVLAGLDLTGFFLERRIFEPHGKTLPPARSRFVDVLRRMATISGG